MVLLITEMVLRYLKKVSFMGKLDIQEMDYFMQKCILMIS